MSGRRREERGLFGIVKKKPVLFTFRPREGEECSSDSEDSDYFPGRQSTDEEDIENFIGRQRSKAARKKVKRTIPLDSKRSSKRSCKRLKLDSSNLNCKKSPPIRLPPEILLRVFIFGIQSEGITKFLPRVSRVCKEWHEISSDPTLLKHLDLSVRGEGGDSSIGVNRVINLTKQRLDKLLSSRNLSQCQMLSLAGQVKLNVGHIKTVLSQTPRLASLDLRGCQISADMLKKLPELSPCLERIDLSQLSASAGALSFVHVEGLVKAFGPKLVELRLGNIPFLEYKMDTMLKTIAESCPLLQELDLSLPLRCSSGLIFSVPYSVNMGELAKACPRLTELRLDGHNLCDYSGGIQPYSPAFTKLKIYSHKATTCGIFSTNQQPFYRMFSNNHLTELNLSYSNLSPSVLGTSQVQSVKRLYLCDMRWNDQEPGEVSRCMSAWYESIEVLDLSGNKTNGFNEELTFFMLPESCKSTALQILNLSNSTVLSETVVSILRNCKSLQTIDLTSCRELPRGCKRLFHKEEFSGLMKSLLA